MGIITSHKCSFRNVLSLRQALTNATNSEGMVEWNVDNYIDTYWWAYTYEWFHYYTLINDGDFHTQQFEHNSTHSF